MQYEKKNEQINVATQKDLQKMWMQNGCKNRQYI